MADGNVVPLGATTSAELTPDKVLEAALRADLAEVIVIGYDRDGALHLASCSGDMKDVLWLIEVAKKRVLEDVRIVPQRLQDENPGEVVPFPPAK